jgi:ABC-type multidrug transport system fused ATPase/permease subunit
MGKLKQMFKENWGKILFSYFLFTLQSISIIIYPKVLGEFIDHLIVKDYSYVIYLILTFLGLMVFNYISRVYDTKVFSKIYRRFASVETSKQFDNGIESTKINGRLTLMSSIVSFFERDMITILNTIYGIIGSLYFISLVDPSMIFYLILSGIATIGVTYYFTPKIKVITKESNDLSEHQSDAINTRNISVVNNLLRNKQKLSVKSSNLDAKFFFMIQLIAYGTVTILITYYVLTHNVTVGGVFSTYRYLFDFCIAISYIPILIPSLINIKDIIKRLESEN